jgi:TRAP-type C4-dicarboxylate transport system permease small subunit
MALVDRLSDGFGRLAAWLFFATGAMITYEVLARYAFNAPTIWAAEISQLFLLWGTFLAMARPLHRGEHIRITVLTGLLGPTARRVMEIASLGFVAAFAAAIAWFGTDIAIDSYVRGRSAGTMLDIPNWWSEAVIPVGFSLLFAQCLVEMVRLALGGPLAADHQSHA